MSWVSLAAILIEFLAPLLLKWLLDLLNDAAKSLDAENLPPGFPSNGQAAEIALWNRAEKMLLEQGEKIWWLNVWGIVTHRHKVKQFTKARLAAYRRRGQFFAAAAGASPIESLTPFEVAEIRA
jgi:hypothetical protein